MICTAKEGLELNKVGGKAFNLARLSLNDFNVPPFIILDTDEFWNFLAKDKERYKELLLNYNASSLSEIRKLIENKEFSLISKERIKTKLDEVFKRHGKIIIRSSATDEDGNNYSFAGMMESYPDLSIEDDVFGYIKKCYLSCFSDRAMEYRALNKLIDEELSMAVIIQSMVESDFSAVAFTTDPQTNDPDEVLISVVKGTGEKLVSGEENSDDYVVDAEGDVRRLSGSLDIDKRIIREIADIGKKIEESYDKKRARDIEIAIKDQKIYVLQERPISAYSHIDKGQFRTIYDNSNIIESYSGVTTPLTFSFAREVYEKVYRQTLNNFFISQEDIESIKEDLANMICFYQNKVYYRLNSWYKMTALYPGYNKNKKYMENMMGVKLELKEGKAKQKLRLFRIYLRFIHKLLRIKKDSLLFVDKFERITKDHFNNSFENYTNKGLVDLYRQLEENILDDFTTPITNDMGAMVFLGILNDALKKKKLSDYEGLLSKVLAKQGNVESLKQSIALIDLVNYINNDTQLKSYYQNTEIEKIIEELDKDNKINKQIKEYIYKYGSRAMEELKLETVTLFQDPRFLIQTIKNYLNMEKIPAVYSDEEFDIKDFYKHFSLFEKLYIKPVTEITKYFVKNRELLRLRRTYIYSIVRNIFLRMGQNFKEEGIIENARDIFFMNKNEAFDIASFGIVGYEDIRTQIEERKKEYEINKEKECYERMYFYGEVKEENMLPIYARQEIISQDLNTLQGVAGGGRVVEGIVKYVKEPEEADIEGYILMAKRTDPGWTVLFPMAKAVIIERGSVLSHSAVIAREMGLTLVVGIRGLTSRVKEGMRVRVDGIKGTVEILEANDEK
jgi:hypothetical protein